MLTFIKYSIKTSVLILLFITLVNNSYANQLLTTGLHSKHSIRHLNGFLYDNLADTISSTQGITDTTVNSQNVDLTGTDRITIPAALLNTAINFQINSYIYYLNIRHFVKESAQKSFIQGWIMEMELNRLSAHADSLRKAYVTASDEQREKISAEIIQSEQASMTLNEQISISYEKAREEENLYWQSASMDEINKFQQKINNYEDSISRSRQQSVNTIVPDTIIMDLPIQNYKEPEPVAEVPSGIIYKIQIGAYKGKVPDSANKLIKKLSMIRKVENQVDDKGVKVITTGNLTSYAEAETMLGQVKQEGVKNAVITAWQNGKKITVAEARKINKEL